jgi:hypothetical protein
MTKMDEARADLDIALELAIEAQKTLTDENGAMRAILAHNEAVLAMLASIEERIEQAVQTLETLDGA